MSLPFFPMFPDDFEADTAHLSMIEDGAYNRLLRLCWRTPGCSIPADRQWVYRHLRARTDEEREAVDAVLDEFFVEEKARLSNPRLSREFDEAVAKHQKHADAGRKGGRPAKSLENQVPDTKPGFPNEKARPKPGLSNQNQNHINPPNPPKTGGGEFENFWAKVPRRVGKRAAEKAWKAAIKRATPEQIMAGLDRHRREVSGKEDRFTPHPATWLNADRWLDGQPAAGASPEQSEKADIAKLCVESYRRTGRPMSQVIHTERITEEIIERGLMEEAECREAGFPFPTGNVIQMPGRVVA